jgi:hypothetical protein
MCDFRTIGKCEELYCNLIVTIEVVQPPAIGYTRSDEKQNLLTILKQHNPSARKSISVCGQ